MGNSTVGAGGGGGENSGPARAESAGAAEDSAFGLCRGMPLGKAGTSGPPSLAAATGAAVGLAAGGTRREGAAPARPGVAGAPEPDLPEVVAEAAAPMVPPARGGTISEKGAPPPLEPVAGFRPASP